MNINSIEDVSWAAGFLDGEGWFGIQHGSQCAIEAAQVATRAPLDELEHLFGGVVRMHGGGRARVWRLTGNNAVVMPLVQLIPYLRVKQHQADRLLQFAMTAKGRGHKLSPVEKQLRDHYVVQLKELKTRCQPQSTM